LICDARNFTNARIRGVMLEDWMYASADKSPLLASGET
jgi:hypothetical protein